MPDSMTVNFFLVALRIPDLRATAGYMNMICTIQIIAAQVKCETF